MDLKPTGVLREGGGSEKGPEAAPVALAEQLFAAQKTGSAEDLPGVRAGPEEVSPRRGGGGLHSGPARWAHAEAAGAYTEGLRGGPTQRR